MKEVNKYNLEYNKKNYKQIKFWLKPEEYQDIEKLAENIGVSKTTLFRMAISCLGNELFKTKNKQDADK